MSDKLIELSSSGLKISTKEEIKTRIKSIISEAYGTDINFNPSYPDGIIVEALATVFRDTFESIQGLYNSFNIRNASGTMLDTLSNLVNVHRKTRTQASGDLEITLASGSSYSWTYFSVKDQNNNIWRNLDSYSLSSQGTDTVIQINLVCDTYGEVEEPSSFTILSPINTNGITINSTLDNFIQGTFDEDDISLRDRTLTAPIRNSVTVKEQLVKLLLENRYVKSVKVYNNDSDGDMALKLLQTEGANAGNGVELPATQIAVIVQYNENLNPSEEDKDSISNIIAEYKGLCSITLNPEGQISSGVIREYSYPDPQDNTITHDIFYIEAEEKLNVGIEVDISRGVNYNSLTTSDYLKSLIETYLGGLEVGENLVIGGLMSYLYTNSDNQFLINNITLSNASTGINNDEYYPSLETSPNLTLTVTVDGA